VTTPAWGGNIRAVVVVEWKKLWMQMKTRAVLAICVAAPFLFILALQLQSTVPSDTLFGRGVKESGFATPLVVLGFAGLWALPVLTSIFGGDLFAAEDRYGAWSTILTRSCSRADIFTGKLLAACAITVVMIAVLAASSVSAGVLVIGSQPLIDLSGVLLSPESALTRVAFAWASVVAPSLGFTAMAVLLSIATRSSTAGVGLPVVIALAMQLASLIDGPDLPRRLLLVSAFTAWRGVLMQPAYYGPLVSAVLVSAAYAVVCIVIAYRIFRRRDIA
jgi:ABC-2 type transport system permease protein